MSEIKLSFTDFSFFTFLPTRRRSWRRHENKIILLRWNYRTMKILKLFRMAFGRCCHFIGKEAFVSTFLLCSPFVSLMLPSVTESLKWLRKEIWSEERCVSFTSHPNGIKDSLNLMKIYKLHQLMHVMCLFFFLLFAFKINSWWQCFWRM